MIKTPVRGMRDILPLDMELRTYVLGVIERHAVHAGFAKIETPALEHRENLTSRIGGENEKLIFEVLKRGESLATGLTTLRVDAANATDPTALTATEVAAAKTLLTDSALRYDLTVPLARYYAANQGELATPFKSLQIGPVWRADAPQKGRYRQFTQCDFDILGDASPLAEIDCIATVGGILQEVCAAAGVQDLTITLNDRRILTAVCATAGFAITDHPAIMIILDKQDKIGLAGVRDELLRAEFAPASVERLIAILQNFDGNADFNTSLNTFAATLDLDPTVITNLQAIYAAVETVLPVRLTFNPCLVRGMGYYTGPIFEVSAAGLGSSIGGGGRYDRMIGQFSGQDVPACGFSIGFERLLVILADLGFRPPVAGKKVALLVSKKLPSTDYARILARASELRAQGYAVSILPMAHNLGKQIGRLEAEGYSEFEKFYGD